MNAIPPEDYSHYVGDVGAISAPPPSASARNAQAGDEDWAVPSGLEMEPDAEMAWVGPFPQL
jgi:hypothetical protein